jgi:hypothetical protein
VRHSGYREGKIVAEFSTEVEEAQKRAERRDQRLCCACPTLAGALQKKISNGLCIPLAHIFAKRPE